MMSVALPRSRPLQDVVTHGFVVDVDGKKISKSSTYSKPMDAGHFVGRHGADLVRLWVSSINYTDDVPFSEEMFTRLGDTYRRIRNTLRILLGNLNDFPADSSVAAVYDRRNASPGEEPTDRRSQTAATIVDRWILDRLQQVIEECRAAYAAYEFHKVYHTLNQFCAVDLSSLYIDITKDRMYCDAPDSPRRRATQSAMLQIFQALCQLLAPILVFTAEEAWSYRDDNRGSVHLQLFPEVQGNLRDPVVREEIEELLKLRGVIGQAVEKARQEKLIGNALEAAVVLRCDERLATVIPREELEEFFILSDLTLEAGEEPAATIAQTPNKKCARCWRHRPTVGTIAAHPELCDRCASVVEVRA